MPACYPPGYSTQNQMWGFLGQGWVLMQWGKTCRNDDTSLRSEECNCPWRTVYQAVQSTWEGSIWVSVWFLCFRFNKYGIQHCISGTGEAKKNQEFCARHHSMWCQQVRKDEGSPETKYTTEVFAGMNLLCWAKVTIATSLHQVVLRADFCPLKSMWELGTAVSSMLLLQHKLGDTSEAKQLAQTWNSP